MSLDWYGGALRDGPVNGVFQYGVDSDPHNDFAPQR
jgi:hypothetical protein